MSENSPKDKQPNSSHQHHAGPTETECQIDKPQSVQSNQNSQNSKRKPTPMEMIREWFDFIRDPGNASAIVAIFTVLIFLTGLAYTVFAALQWGEMRSTIKATQQQIADTRATQAAQI